MTALMVLQQHMTPMSMDPVQKKMMALMPIVMLFMLYDLPSGLTLYWTVSNLFSIIQLKLQQRSRSKENQNTPVKG
jgi:YidC/Oxa1 family membrane protein insertase